MESSAHVTVCPDCDLVLARPDIQQRQNANCPRCGAELYRVVDSMLGKTLAATLSGLILYIPANTLPIMTFEIFDLDSTNTMVNGAYQLFMSGYWWMAFLVLMCSVVVPLLDLVLLFIISWRIRFSCKTAFTKKCLLWQQTIEEWGMLEVYMIGILIAYIKMIDMGNIIVDTGLYCFIGMLLSTMIASTVFDTETAFNMLDEQDKNQPGNKGEPA